MKKEEAVIKLKEIIREAGDTECDHCEADDVLCDLLESLGHSDVVELYREIEKWYA